MRDNLLKGYKGIKEGTAKLSGFTTTVMKSAVAMWKQVSEENLAIPVTESHWTIGSLNRN